MPLTKEVQLWVPQHHRRVKKRLLNWGRWAGGEIQDPALVHYYTECPYIPTKRTGRPVPRIDVMDAERTEKVLLSLRNSSKLGAYYFRMLRSRYAYGRLVRELAETRNLTVSQAYNTMYTAEFEFHRKWMEWYYGLPAGEQQRLDV